ncbi:hypothetical protein JRO89_XSUnG0166300 [Xanthoceras sorbifolium]|uniref:CBS domain-containing protein n=1 Tax=Xanthoceras sorbifolium TaxID=99658 RepID=A0ABQ8GXP1_9ROSI|nr:hypothetical protein JRO89_XSUnG0166300 [Xanthoceras sorbifolium]
MKETKKMDLKQLEDVMKDPGGGGGGGGGGVVEKKETLNSDHIQNKPPLDSATALQAFLDHIPISSIPGIKNSPVLELDAGKSVRDAIELLYEKNVCGAPIADVADPDATIGRFSDRYIGFIDLASIILWSLEVLQQWFAFVLLQVQQIGELAKSFLWESFFPVRLDDTLFHVLLLLSKHRLNVVPVIERPDSQIMGFVTQNAVFQLLLQSNGLDWFDGIADKALSEFRFENEDHVVQVCGDQSVAEAMQILCKNRVGIIAVVDRGTKRLIGGMRRSDIYLLLENDNIYHKRETLSMEEFVHTDTSKTDSDPAIERDIGALLSAGVLRLRNSFLPRMDQPVTNKKIDPLKQAMKNLAETKSFFSFLVDDLQQVTGVLTIRDIIIQFAPPCIDSSIHGGGFFESALEQAGCKIENGTMICDH